MKAEKDLKNLFKEEMRQERIQRHQKRHLKKFDCPHVRTPKIIAEITPTDTSTKGDQDKRKSVSSIKKPKSKVLNPSPLKRLGNKPMMKMVCTKCSKPVFNYQESDCSSSSFCRCGGKGLSFGCFWQEPHPKDKSLLNTIVCYRTKNKCCFGKTKSAKGTKSATKLVVKMPGGNLKLDYHSIDNIA